MYLVIRVNSEEPMQATETIINCFGSLAEAKKSFKEECDLMLEDQNEFGGIVTINEDILEAEYESEQLCSIVKVEECKTGSTIVVNF